MKGFIKKTILLFSLLMLALAFQACATKNPVIYTDETKTAQLADINYAPVKGLLCFDTDLPSVSEDVTIKEESVEGITLITDDSCISWLGGHTFEDIKEGCSVITSVEGLEPAYSFIRNYNNENESIPAEFKITEITIGSSIINSDLHFEVSYDCLNYGQTYEASFGGYIGLLDKSGTLCAVINLGYEATTPFGSGPLSQFFDTKHKLAISVSSEDSSKLVAKCIADYHDNCLIYEPTLTITVDPVYVGYRPVIHAGTEAERSNWASMGLNLPPTYTMYDSLGNQISGKVPTNEGDYTLKIIDTYYNYAMVLNVHAVPFSGVVLKTKTGSGEDATEKDVFVNSLNDTMGDLKAAVAKGYDYDVKHLTLTFNSNEYADSKVLSDIGIDESSVINVVVSAHEGGTANCQKGKICTKCGREYSARDLKLHSSTEIKGAVVATCSSDGFEGNTCCKSCGTIVKRGNTISKTGHSKAKSNKYVKVQATCKSQGENYYECSSCHIKLEETYKTEILTTHTLEDKITPATTSADGKIESKCKVCNKTIGTEPILKAYVRINKTVAYNKGKAVKTTINVTDKDGNKIPAQYYTVSYSKNKNLGKASLTVTFTDHYSGTYKDSFIITNKKEIPAKTSVKKLTAGKKAFTVTWKAISKECTGYEIQYSTDKNFLSSDTKTVKITKAKTSSKVIKKLKAKQVYYVRLRAVNKDGRKNTVTSSWSSTKKITTK